jgi:hypothetical protein
MRGAKTEDVVTTTPLSSPIHFSLVATAGSIGLEVGAT